MSLQFTSFALPALIGNYVLWHSLWHCFLAAAYYNLYCGLGEVQAKRGAKGTLEEDAQGPMPDMSSFEDLQSLQ